MKNTRILYMNIELLMRAEHRQELQFEASMPCSFIQPQYFCDWQNCYITQWRQSLPACLDVVCDNAQYWEVICFAMLNLKTCSSILSTFCGIGSSEVIWLSNSAVCKFHHDLYEVNAFWTAMIPQCATVIESWCGSSSAWPSGLETRTRPRTKSPAMHLAASLAKMMAMIFVLRIVSAQSTLPRGLAIGEATASVNS